MKFFIVSLFLCAVVASASAQMPGHIFHQLESDLTKLNKNYPTKTYLYSIGKSVENRDLWVLALADNMPDMHMPMRPDVKLVATIAANQVPSKDILLQLADYMLKNQNTDPDVDFILKNTRLHILPVINPDGMVRAIPYACGNETGRLNANGVDLDQNFNDFFQCLKSPMQPEVQAIKDWMHKINFLLSANVHTGNMVVYYPYDDFPGSPEGSHYSATSYDNELKSLALGYTANHPYMRTTVCPGKQAFTNGVINGAEWYVTPGSMGDYNYWHFGTLEITIELSCCSYPNATETAQLFLDNQKPLLQYLRLANTGLRGKITFANGMPAVNVSVEIDSRDPIKKTDQLGEYYNFLLPGTYNLSIRLGCDKVFQETVTITDSKTALRHDIVLSNEIYAKYLSVKSTLDQETIYCKPNYQRVPCVRPPYVASGSPSSSNKKKQHKIIIFSLVNLFTWLFVTFVSLKL